VLVSLIAAIVAAVFYGVASVMQAIAVRAASNKPADAAAGGVDPGLVVRMLHQWRFVVSICLDTLGFLAQLVALHRLPLFAVQAFVASNLAVTAVVASWVIGVNLSWREWTAVLGVVAGVGLLGSSAGAEGAAQVGAVFKLALIVAVAGLAVVGMAAAKLNEPFRTTALGLVAGFGFGLLGIAARVLIGFRAAPAGARPGRLCHRRGRHRVVHVLRHRARGRQRDRGHGGRCAGRDGAARHHRRHLPGRSDQARTCRCGVGRVLHRGRLGRHAGQIR
jgi:drug/metabolite transporter (DMT)-like permease